MQNVLSALFPSWLTGWCAALWRQNASSCPTAPSIQQLNPTLSRLYRPLAVSGSHVCDDRLHDFTAPMPKHGQTTRLRERAHERRPLTV